MELQWAIQWQIKRKKQRMVQRKMASHLGAIVIARKSEARAKMGLKWSPREIEKCLPRVNERNQSTKTMIKSKMTKTRTRIKNPKRKKKKKKSTIMTFTLIRNWRVWSGWVDHTRLTRLHKGRFGNQAQKSRNWWPSCRLSVRSKLNTTYFPWIKRTRHSSISISSSMETIKMLWRE